MIQKIERSREKLTHKAVVASSFEFSNPHIHWRTPHLFFFHSFSNFQYTYFLYLFRFYIFIRVLIETLPWFKIWYALKKHVEKKKRRNSLTTMMKLLRYVADERRYFYQLISMAFVVKDSAERYSREFYVVVMVSRGFLCVSPTKLSYLDTNKTYIYIRYPEVPSWYKYILITIRVSVYTF